MTVMFSDYNIQCAGPGALHPTKYPDNTLRREDLGHIDLRLQQSDLRDAILKHL